MPVLYFCWEAGRDAPAPFMDLTRIIQCHCPFRPFARASASPAKPWRRRRSNARGVGASRPEWLGGGARGPGSFDRHSAPGAPGAIYACPLLSSLGLLGADPEDFLKSLTLKDEGWSLEAIENLIQQRLDARHNKNWAEADRIRNELKEHGILLEDGAGRTTWRRE